MLEIRFTVRPDQGESHGFDMGDMEVRGEGGIARSAGHTPDQGMMIHLSAIQLLDGVQNFLRSRIRTYRFIGVDTSFGLVFRRTKTGVSIATQDGVFARTSTSELTIVLAEAASALGGSLTADDPAAGDYQTVLSNFRSMAAAT